MLDKVMLMLWQVAKEEDLHFVLHPALHEALLNVLSSSTEHWLRNVYACMQSLQW